MDVLFHTLLFADSIDNVFKYRLICKDISNIIMSDYIQEQSIVKVSKYYETPYKYLNIETNEIDTIINPNKIKILITTNCTNYDKFSNLQKLYIDHSNITSETKLPNTLRNLYISNINNSFNYSPLCKNITCLVLTGKIWIGLAYLKSRSLETLILDVDHLSFATVYNIPKLKMIATQKREHHAFILLDQSVKRCVL